jgi:ATP-binding cassette, subfamily B, bacterial
VDLRDQLIALAVVTAVVWLLESAFQYAYEVLWRNLAQTIQHEIRLDAYAHVQGSSRRTSRIAPPVG